MGGELFLVRFDLAAEVLGLILLDLALVDALLKVDDTIAELLFELL